MAAVACTVSNGAGTASEVLQDLLSAMVREEASDLFLIAGAVPTIRRHGDYLALTQQPLAALDIRAFAMSVMSPAQAEAFEIRKECDLALHVPNAGRFRINVHLQRGQTGMVVRHVSSQIPSLEALGLPPVVHQLAFSQARPGARGGRGGRGQDHNPCVPSGPSQCSDSWAYPDH